MTRPWIWSQLLIGWLPIGALFAVLILAVHTDVSPGGAVFLAVRMIVTAAALGVVVQRLTERHPWPWPFRASFAAWHAVAAVAYAAAWIALNSVVESVLHLQIVIAAGPGIVPFLVTGVWIYIMVAGVSYATRESGRAARAEADAARAQLAALRSQLHPHFLFNALHTVVHLIPRDPERAARAAEEIGGLLRRTIEEDRDLVSLAEERAFVERYLDVERLRFGDRLKVVMTIDVTAEATLVPAFALLTLVENAVRHGVEPSVDPTTITVTGEARGDALHLTVRDNGAGTERTGSGQGTGHARLRDRIAALYGSRAGLRLTPGAPRGYEAALTIPRVEAE